MKKKIISFLNKYWILLSFLSIFTIYILPVCFQNNNNLNLVSAEHIDSGSILGSIMQMNSKNTPNSFYNQNIPYHTGFYGYPYNSIVFWSFKFEKIFFRSYANINFYIFPLIAKLLNFIFASFSIIYLYQLSRKILKYNLSRILLLSLFIIFPEYLHYVFHIKPDILGLLFSIISLNYLYDYLQNSKNNKNIIKANVFGGLSILCKQPHIFIIFPLLIGFVSSLKGNLKEKLSIFFKTYLYSGIIFLFLFFIIHPYAFLELKAFLARQILMTSMTSASYIDNINFWLPTFIGDPLLFIFVFTPFIFILLNLFKKFRNKTTLFLLLISTYIISYLLWLTLKVGPMRFIHYLIPVFPFSILIFSYIFDFFFNKTFCSKSKINQIFYLTIFITVFLLSVKTINYTIIKTKNIIQSPYDFQKTETYKATKKFEKEFSNEQLNKKTIIYSISLPVNDTLYENSINTWQVNEKVVNELKPEYLFIDFTVYWEKPYEYWEKIAKQNELNKEMLFIDNFDKEKNIVLFYK
ncbi:MAG: hypothetical protein WC720_03010 [Candidatus Shapirobacteria bacterium]|jgi:hypothetical protein